jgi:hypothetical protein
MIGFTTMTKFLIPCLKDNPWKIFGPTAPKAGSVLSAKILTSNMNVIWQNTIRHITPLEKETQEIITAKANFTMKLNDRLGDAIKQTSP